MIYLSAGVNLIWYRVACTHVGSLSKFTPRYFVVYIWNGYYNVICVVRSHVWVRMMDVMWWYDLFLLMFFFSFQFSPTYTARFYTPQWAWMKTISKVVGGFPRKSRMYIYIYIYIYIALASAYYSATVYTRLCRAGEMGWSVYLKLKYTT
jgi:hypothetical protein